MRIRVPFKYADRVAAYEALASKADIHRAYRTAPLRDVPLSLLRATQHTVGSERLLQYAADPKTEPHNGPPVVVEIGGHYYIHNGHHRGTLAAMRGDRTLRAKVVRLGDQSPRTFGRPGGLYLMRHDFDMAKVVFDAHDVEDVCDVVDGGIAVLNIEGPLEDKGGGAWWSYFDDYESILCRFRNALESGDVRGVLLKLDSPGGTAAGLNECVDAMIEAAKKAGKPVWSYADEGAYSAAFALALVGERIFLPRAGGLGSIGVVSEMRSQTKANERAGVEVRVYTSGKRKADGNPNLPISHGAEKHVQRRIDQLAKLFWRLAADRRGVSRGYIRSLEADTFYGKDAVKKRLADGVMSLDACVQAFRKALDSGPQNTRASVSSSREPRAPKTRTERVTSHMLPEQLRLNAACAALAAAQGSKSKTAKAQVEFDSATAALAKALAKAGPSAGKHYKRTETADESTPSSSSSSAGSSGGSSAASMPMASGSSSSGSSSSGSEGEEGEEKDEKALVSLARKLTGRASAKEALGALLAIGEKSAGADKTAARVARLEADRRVGKVDALIAQGKTDGKVTPGNEKKLRKIAAEHGHRALRSFIEAMTPAVLPELPEPDDAQDVAAVKLSAEDKRQFKKMGIPESQWGGMSKMMARRDAERAGKRTPERDVPKELVSRGAAAKDGE